MLGVGMLFVGVTLISNGLGGLLKIDKKSLAVMNGFTGVLSFIINLVYLWCGDYYAAQMVFYLHLRICLSHWFQFLILMIESMEFFVYLWLSIQFLVPI